MHNCSGCVVRQWHVTDAAARRWRRYQSLAAEASRAESATAPGDHGGPAPAAEPGCAESSATNNGPNGPFGPTCASNAPHGVPNQASAACTPRASKRRRVERCRLRDSNAGDSSGSAPCELHDTVGAVCVGPRGAACKFELGVGCPH